MGRVEVRQASACRSRRQTLSKPNDKLKFVGHLLRFRTLEKRVVDLDTVGNVENPGFLNLFSVFHQDRAVRHQRALSNAIVQEPPLILLGGRTARRGRLILEPQDMKRLRAQEVTSGLLVLSQIHNVWIEAFLLVLAHQSDG